MAAMEGRKAGELEHKVYPLQVCFGRAAENIVESPVMPVLLAEACASERCLLLK